MICRALKATSGEISCHLYDRLDSEGTIGKMTEICRMPLFIGKHYLTEILCDVIDMDTSHTLLGRPWQFDVDINYREKDNSRLFMSNS